MATVQTNDDEHVPLPILWAYRIIERTLSKDERAHLSGCDACWYLLLVCEASDTLEEVTRRMTMAAMSERLESDIP